jgi:lipopolysaccharide export system permease protein
MIIARYLSIQMALAIALVLAALLGLFAFFDLLGQIDGVGRNGYSYGVAAAYVLLNLPARLYEIMPIAVLIGAIYALAQFASSSEFTAMRAAGLGRVQALKSLAWLALVVVSITFFVGEFVAPPLERWSQSIRGIGSDTRAVRLRSGAWIKDTVKDDKGAIERQRFVNVGLLNANPEQGAGELTNLKVYEFDRQARLVNILSAKSGRFSNAGQWTLTDVTSTQYDEVNDPALGLQLQSVVTKLPTLLWRSSLTPDLFGVLSIDPARMSALRLYQYVAHLKENQQRSDRYEIAMWHKFVYPLVCAVMLVLALPFGYLNVRSGGIGYKVSAGVMLGVGFYFLNGLFSHLGLLNTWPAWVAASAPSLIATALALGLLYWVDRA